MYWTSSSGRIELNITRRDADSCSHGGRCDSDIHWLLHNNAKIHRQMVKIDCELIKEELREYGAWDDEELKCHEDNMQRLLWIACCDISEGR